MCTSLWVGCNDIVNVLTLLIFCRFDGESDISDREIVGFAGDDSVVAETQMEVRVVPETQMEVERHTKHEVLVDMLQLLYC